MRLTVRILNAIASFSDAATTLDMSAEDSAAVRDASNWAKEELARRAELKNKGKSDTTPATSNGPATTA